jgi:hypothetical protein
MATVMDLRFPLADDFLTGRKNIMAYQGLLH